MNGKDELTKQEANILALVAQGLRTAKIAQELYISPRTVETHLLHIYEKLGVSSRTEAALYALHASSAMPADQDRIPDRRPQRNRYANPLDHSAAGDVMAFTRMTDSLPGRAKGAGAAGQD